MTNFYGLAGTERAALPAKTLERLRPLYAKVGITRIANLSGLDPLNLPVVSAIRPSSKNLAIALGKGLSVELAEISAVMESLEAYHAENLTEADLQGSFVELSQKGLNLLNPEQLQQGSLVHQDLKNQKLDWVNAENLTEAGAKIYLPQAIMDLDLAKTNPHAFYFQVSSNGLAAGNTLAEATCHALFEIIERDAFYQFGQKTLTTRDQRQLNIASISNLHFQKLWQQIQHTGLSLKLWDLTHSSGVPVFHACLYDESLLSPIYFSSGSGAHFSKDIALLRAVTEAVQTRTALVSGSRDDIYPSYYLYQQKLAEQHNQSKTHDPAQLITWGSCSEMEHGTDFIENVQLLTQAIQQPVYRVDLTRSDLGIPVVFVLAPHFGFTGVRS